ncbi:MAG: glycosyltransferase, partial [Bacteroidetes bacterium]|nr:glycosyltransferase [Bacteroidota bacterium]
DSFRLIYVGRIDNEKRVDRAIDLISQLKKENVDIHLFIFGNGDLMNEIRLQIERLNVQKLITFLGIVKNPKIYFKLFDTLILTSDREGLPLVIWEAMSQGLPIISTDVGGVKEIINDARCGLLFNKNNLKDGSLLIKRILGDDYLKKSLGVNGLNAIGYKYNQANFDKQIDGIYSCLVRI